MAAKVGAISYGATYLGIKGFSLLDHKSKLYQDGIPYVTVLEGFAIRAPRTFSTFIYVYLNHKAHRLYYDFRGGSKEEIDQNMKETHVYNAEVLLSLCLQNGGVWIKLGQGMASMRGFLPDEYCDILSKTFNHVPHVDFDDIEPLFVQDFGGKVSELYRTFDTVPFAAASLAQVHKATLHNGEEVAVKVQFPKVKYYYRLDIKVSQVIRKISFRAQGQEMREDIENEISNNLENELNFTLEAQNTAKARKNFEHIDYMYVPEVVKPLSSSRILTMEFIHGVLGKDLEGLKKVGWDLSVVADHLFSGLAEQIFTFGFCHADPHSGNYFIRPNPKKPREPQIVLIDHGLYNEFSDEFRLGYAKFWKSLVLGDQKGIDEYCASIGITNSDIYAKIVKFQAMDNIGPQVKYDPTRKNSKHGLPSDPARMQAKSDDRQKFFAENLKNIMQNVPKEMILLFRTNFLLRAANQLYGVPVDRFAIFARIAKRNAMLAEPKVGFLKSWYDSISYEVALKITQFYSQIISLFIWLFGPTSKSVSPSI